MLIVANFRTPTEGIPNLFKNQIADMNIVNYNTLNGKNRTKTLITIC